MIKVISSEWIVKHKWNSKYTVFTILNRDKYQVDETQKKHKKNAEETQEETDNNDNNDNNDKEYKNNVENEIFSSWVKVNTNEKTNAKKKKLLQKVFDGWNSVKTIPVKNGSVKWLKVCDVITQDIEEVWRKIYLRYSKEQIEYWIESYINNIAIRDKEQAKTFYSHRFTLYQFLGQDNWLKKFINS